MERPLPKSPLWKSASSGGKGLWHSDYMVKHGKAELCHKEHHPAIPTPHILGTFTTTQSLYNTLPVTRQCMEKFLHFLVGQIPWKCYCALYQSSKLKSNKEINTIVEEVEGGGWRELSQWLLPSQFVDLAPMKTWGTEVQCAIPVVSGKRQEDPEAHWPSF